jgi:drug/metabolite transporter (DMT)-like permease
MISIALALTSALSWGTGDFLGGLAARRYGLAWVLCGTALGGLLTGVAVSLISGDAFPPAREVLLAAVAGVAGLIGLACFYHALAIGTMSIVAPISATGITIPVAWGVIQGEHLSSLAVGAIVVVIVGVMLASREHSPVAAETSESHALSVLLALAAAVGFGLVFLLIAETADTSVYWPSAILKAATLAGAALFVLGRTLSGGEIGPRPAGRHWLFPISIGFFDVSANVSFAAATTHGTLAVASVVSSLYPVTTVILAFIFLHERLATSQRIGVAMALLGVAMLAAT